MRRGEKIDLEPCVDCHGETGDGAGLLAEGFDVKPRDFRQAIGDVARYLVVFAPSFMAAWRAHQEPPHFHCPK